jgi:hypothetical protein
MPRFSNAVFELTSDHEFLLRAAVLAHAEFRLIIEAEIAENSEAFMGTAKRLLCSKDGGEFAKVLAPFDLSSLPLSLLKRMSYLQSFGIPQCRRRLKRSGKSLHF